MSKNIPSFRKSPKGEKPAPAPAPAPSSTAVESFLEKSAMVSRPPAAAGTDLDENSVYRTVNVKLNKRRYTNLKLLSTMTETSMQQYLVALVDELIERNKHLLPDIKAR